MGRFPPIDPAGTIHVYSSDWVKRIADREHVPFVEQVASDLRGAVRHFRLRDPQRFPPDRIGDKLFQHWKEGGSEHFPLVVTFSIFFEDKKCADRFAFDLVVKAAAQEWPVLHESDFFGRPGLVVDFAVARNLWEVRYCPLIAPSSSNIREIDSHLGLLAATHNGLYEGW